MKSPTKNKGRKAYDPAVSFRLSPQVLAEFDSLDKATGLGRSSLLRLAVVRGLRGLEADLAAVAPANRTR